MAIQPGSSFRSESGNIGEVTNDDRISARGCLVKLCTRVQLCSTPMSLNFSQKHDLAERMPRRHLDGWKMLDVGDGTPPWTLVLLHCLASFSQIIIECLP